MLFWIVAIGSVLFFVGYGYYHYRLSQANTILVEHTVNVSGSDLNIKKNREYEFEKIDKLVSELNNAGVEVKKKVFSMTDIMEAGGSGDSKVVRVYVAKKHTKKAKEIKTQLEE